MILSVKWIRRIIIPQLITQTRNVTRIRLIILLVIFSFHTMSEYVF